jgi:tight adherence protein B
VIQLLAPLLVALVVFAAAVQLLARRRTAAVRRRVAAHVEPRAARVEVEPEEERQSRRSRLLPALRLGDEQLRRLPGWERYAALVDRADLSLRPVELFYLAVGGTTGIVLVLAAAGVSAFVSGLLALAALFGAGMLVVVRIDRRRRAFEQHLPDLLAGLASALRAGHGLSQALQAAAEDAPEPAASELQRLLAETRLGRPLEDALSALGRRVGSRDFDFVLDAVVIQRQVGGSLAGIFEIVAGSVRQRQQFVLKIRALTAMGRTSALVLLGLPFAMAVLLSLLNPSYFAPLLHTYPGHAMLAGSAVLLATGTLWLRKVVVFRG